MIGAGLVLSDRSHSLCFQKRGHIDSIRACALGLGHILGLNNMLDDGIRNHTTYVCMIPASPNSILIS